MQVIPAIDLKDGRCVRLLRGDFNQETRYSEDPVALAGHYRDIGAAWLHVVDLDGAQSGTRGNGELIRQLAGVAGLALQVGGGIRSDGDLEQILRHAQRAVIGSVAIEEPDRMEQWLDRYGPERLTLALDVSLDDTQTPWVVIHGWQSRSTTTLREALDRFARLGLRHVLCTDVSRDGALTGPNTELYRSVASEWPRIEMQASGGVSSRADLDGLAATGVAAAITGKALLEGRITNEELGPFLPNA